MRLKTERCYYCYSYYVTATHVTHLLLDMYMC